MTVSSTLRRSAHRARATNAILLAVAWAIVVFAAPLPARCADEAGKPQRYVWRRQDDWTARPDAEHGKGDGNPDDDANGRRVWSYEYYANVPDKSGLGEGDKPGPWYARRTGGKMVWDKKWGAEPAWAVADNINPAISKKGMSHVNCDTPWAKYNRVPVVRWTNLTGRKLTLRLRAGKDFRVKWSGVGARGWPCSIDVAIVLVDASDGGRVIPIYTRPFDKPTKNAAAEEMAMRGVDIPELRIDPGDQILFTVRAAQQYRGGGARWVSLYDDITMKGARVSPARPAAHPAKAMTSGRLMELWTLLRQGGDKADDALDELSLGGDGMVAHIVKALRKTLSDGKRIASWIKQLDADSWKQRVAATEALKRQGPIIAGILRDALAVAESLEAKQRLKLILASLASQRAASNMATVGLRTVLLLRRIGSPAAKAVLKDLAASPSTPLVRHQAATALSDLAPPRRPRSRPATRQSTKKAG